MSLSVIYRVRPMAMRYSKMERVIPTTTAPSNGAIIQALLNGVRTAFPESHHPEVQKRTNLPPHQPFVPRIHFDDACINDGQWLLDAEG